MYDGCLELNNKTYLLLLNYFFLFLLVSSCFFLFLLVSSPFVHVSSPFWKVDVYQDSFWKCLYKLSLYQDSSSQHLARIVIVLELIRSSKLITEEDAENGSIIKIYLQILVLSPKKTTFTGTTFPF